MKNYWRFLALDLSTFVNIYMLTEKTPKCPTQKN